MPTGPRRSGPSVDKNSRCDRAGTIWCGRRDQDDLPAVVLPDGRMTSPSVEIGSGIGEEFRSRRSALQGGARLSPATGRGLVRGRQYYIDVKEQDGLAILGLALTHDHIGPVNLPDRPSWYGLVFIWQRRLLTFTLSQVATIHRIFYSQYETDTVIILGPSAALPSRQTGCQCRNVCSNILPIR